MRHVGDDPAQLVLLAYPSTDAFDHALDDLRDLRLAARVHVEALGQLARQDEGAFAYVTDVWDEHTFQGALLAVIADILVGRATVDHVQYTVAVPDTVSAQKSPVKRIDRGILAAGFKPLRAAIEPGTSAIVALVRKSMSAELAEAIRARAALAAARQSWLDLRTDLDLLITDVLGAHVTVSPALVRDAQAPGSASTGL